jgi:putative hydrolase of the HAD superfamily
MDESEVRVVWCDFGGVLTSPIADAANEVAAAAGLTWDQLWQGITDVAHGMGLEGMQPLELGMLSQTEWGARVTRQLPLDHQPRIDLGSWDDHWYRGRHLDGELLDELRRIRRGGTRVGMLTNSVREWEPHRAKLLNDSEFDAIVRSHEIRLAKPDPAIYRYAGALLEAPPEQTLLIDDSDANCLAAAARGWQTIHHTQTSDTISILRSLLP